MNHLIFLSILEERPVLGKVTSVLYFLHLMMTVSTVFPGNDFVPSSWLLRLNNDVDLMLCKLNVKGLKLRPSWSAHLYVFHPCLLQHTWLKCSGLFQLLLTETFIYFFSRVISIVSHNNGGKKSVEMIYLCPFFFLPYISATWHLNKATSTFYICSICT